MAESIIVVAELRPARRTYFLIPFALPILVGRQRCVAESANWTGEAEFHAATIDQAWNVRNEVQ